MHVPTAVDKNEIAGVERISYEIGVILHRHEQKLGSPKNFWYRHFNAKFHWKLL